MNYERWYTVQNARAFYLSHRASAAALSRADLAAESDPMGLEKAEMRYERNINGSAEYIRGHWEHIIADAITS